MKMHVGIYAPDSGFPNYALMKISRYHKNKGDTVGWYTPLESPSFDKVYVSQIFSFNPRASVLHDNVEWGGSGISVSKQLPKEIDDLEPDLSMYPSWPHALSYLQKGCIRTCDFCIVPKLFPDGPFGYRDIEQVMQGRETVVLMDDNIISHPYGISQIEKIIKLKIKVDFNQGLDGRLIDKPMAKLLAKVRWLKPLRMACDSDGVMKAIGRAAKNLREAGVKPVRFFCYMLVKDVESGLRRANYLKSINVDPFAMPYRGIGSREAGNPAVKDFARWVNRKAIFKSVTWEDYKKRKGIVS